MRRILCCLLMAILAFTLPVNAQEAPVLPDPAPYISALGQLILEDVDLNGTACDVYGYSFYRSVSFSFALMAYEWSVTGQGFSWELQAEESSEDGMSVARWYAVSMDGHTAYLNLTGHLMNKSCALTVYVPEGMVFTPVTELKNATPFHNDLFLDSNAAWIGSMPDSGTDSDTPVVCSYCHGSGKCPECHGSRRFRNPYTGSSLDCSCGDGKCSVCDGEGSW